MKASTRVQIIAVFVTLNLSSAQAASTAKPLRLFWWNICAGGYVSKSVDEQNVRDGKPKAHLIEHSLQKVIESSESPDVILFGEFIEKNAEGTLPSESLKLLDQHYPYSSFFSYNNTLRTEFGIAVYSKTPFRKKTAKLDWVDPDQSCSEQKTFADNWGKMDSAVDFVNGFKRKLIEIDLSWNGEEIAIFPIHFNQPWSFIKAAHASSPIPLEGKVRAFLELSRGTDNPLFYQAKQFNRLIQKKVKQVEDLKNLSRSAGGDRTFPKRRMIVLGDFNLPDPRTFSNWEVPAWKLVTQSLKPVLQSSVPTFPTEESSESKEMPALRIDHIFTSFSETKVKGKVRNELGSDHYPIEATLLP